MITETEPKGWADLEAEYQSLTGRTAERPVWDFIGKLVALVRRIESALSAAQGECDKNFWDVLDRCLKAAYDNDKRTAGELAHCLVQKYGTKQQRIAELERELATLRHAVAGYLNARDEYHEHGDNCANEVRLSFACDDALAILKAAVAAAAQSNQEATNGD